MLLWQGAASSSLPVVVAVRSPCKELVSFEQASWILGSKK